MREYCEIVNINNLETKQEIRFKNIVQYVESIPDKIIPQDKKGFANTVFHGDNIGILIDEEQRQYILSFMKERYKYED